MRALWWVIGTVYVLGMVGFALSSIRSKAYRRGYSAAMRSMREDLARWQQELNLVQAEYRKVRKTYDRILTEYRQVKSTAPPPEQRPQ